MKHLILGTAGHIDLPDKGAHRTLSTMKMIIRTKTVAL
jgi:hypothetical protein